MTTFTALHTAASKVCPEHVDLQYHLSVLFSFPENEWFTPTNLKDEEYSICQALSNANIISERTIPYWKDGSFRGIKMQFLYNKEMDFSQLNN